MTTERNRAAKAAADIAAETDADSDFDFDADYDDEADFDDEDDYASDGDEGDYASDGDEADDDEMATTVDLAPADVRDSGEGGRGRLGPSRRPIARPVRAVD